MPKDKVDQNASSKVCTFFLEGNCKFETKCRNLHPVDQLSPHFKRLHLSKYPPKAKEEECDAVVKKPRMKTAAELISRLQWDEMLPRDLFIVGYLDRFRGIIEKPFNVFDWSDPATVDIYALSIPKHRIQYFKYKHKKVWDKSERTDIVFGSTGSRVSISDFMKKVDSEQEIILEMAEEDNAAINDKDKQSPAEFDQKPNFFIAVKPENEQFLEKVSMLRSELIEKLPFLEFCCLEASKYHITVSLLQIEDLSEIAQIVHALRHNTTYLFGDEVVKLKIKGIGAFGNRVIYLKIENGDELYDFVERLNSVIYNSGSQAMFNYNFNPHLTIMKVPKSCTAHELPPSLWDDFKDCDLGTLLINNISLCAVGNSKEKFYECVTEITIK